MQEIELLVNSPAEASERILQNNDRVPFIVRGLEIGECSSKWSDSDYLKNAVGEKKVVTHVCAQQKLDFLTKNFKYQTIPFNDLIDRCRSSTQKDPFLSESENYYLRSVADDQRKDVASMERDFPELWPDLKIPDFVLQEKIFSSVFRISSPNVQLWTHYDIMDNILFQIVGRKRVVLFSPLDVPYMYLSGDKSRVLDVENPDLELFPLFPKATQYVGVLEQGDAVYIPALWFHNTKALSYSIGVNVFWRHLENDFYDPKDLYGNNDLQAAQRAQQGLAKALKTVKTLPEPYRKFYGLRMIEQIRSSLQLE